MNFWELVGIFSVILLWKINYSQILEIIRIIEKFQKCGTISRLLIWEFLKFFWDILIWKIYFIGLLGMLELLNLLRNFGIVSFICIMVVWRKDKNCEKCMKWKKKEKKWNSDEKWKPVWGELRRERDPQGERPKSLPQEDSEWGMYLGADTYPSVKTWEQ